MEKWGEAKRSSAPKCCHSSKGTFTQNWKFTHYLQNTFGVSGVNRVSAQSNSIEVDCDDFSQREENNTNTTCLQFAAVVSTIFIFHRPFKVYAQTGPHNDITTSKERCIIILHTYNTHIDVDTGLNHTLRMCRASHQRITIWRLYFINPPVCCSSSDWLIEPQGLTSGDNVSSSLNRDCKLKKCLLN